MVVICLFRENLQIRVAYKVHGTMLGSPDSFTTGSSEERGSGAREMCSETMLFNGACLRENLLPNDSNKENRIKVVQDAAMQSFRSYC